ncbi:MAG: hypothetical protein K0S19_2162 [Geminicoccaceae bacterium]|nr:hypothetical protein [Geminicoccaceae bacterium]
MTGLGGTVAVRDDVAIRCNPLRRVTRSKVGLSLPDTPEPLLSEIVLPVMIDGARNMAPAHLGSGLSGILIRRACINQDVSSRHGLANFPQGDSFGEKGARRKSRCSDMGIALDQWPLLQLPFEIAAVQQEYLRVTIAGQEPGQESRVDVPSLTRTVDHDRRIEAHSEPRKELAVGSSAQELSRYALLAGPQSLRVEVYRAWQMILEISEHVRLNVHQGHSARLHPCREGVGGHEPGQRSRGSIGDQSRSRDRCPRYSEAPEQKSEPGPAHGAESSPM